MSDYSDFVGEWPFSNNLVNIFLGYGFLIYIWRKEYNIVTNQKKIELSLILKGILNNKRKIFLVEYMTFIVIALIGGLFVVTPSIYLSSFSDKVVMMGVFSVSHFLFKFGVYQFIKSFDLSPLTNIILAFIITFHFFAPIPALLLNLNWILYWKAVYTYPHLLLLFTIPAYLSFFLTVFIYFNSKDYA